MTIRERLLAFIHLIRLHRPIGILLLLWPTLWALWIAADGTPDLKILAIFVAGVVLMRSAGCAINDYADRDIDPFVQRTRDRPLVTGRLTEKDALEMFILLSLLAFILVLQLNLFTILLALVAVALVGTYPFIKRYTYFPQVYLGAAFGWSIPMAFAAVTNDVPLLAWVMFAANVFWVVAYDTLYAMVDREDDIMIGVKSTAIFFGSFDRFMVGLNHLLALDLMIFVGILANLGVMYYLGLVMAAGFAIYQQRMTRTREREQCFYAFLNNNWFGAAIFAGVVLHYFVEYLFPGL